MFDESIKKFKFGRSSDCDIVCENKNLSRIHCTFLFKNQNWYVINGDIDNSRKKCTNGLWYILI